MTAPPTIWIAASFRIDLGKTILPEKLYRKMDRPPKPWKRCLMRKWGHSYVRFSCYIRTTDTPLPLDWIEVYRLRLLLIAKPVGDI